MFSIFLTSIVTLSLIALSSAHATDFQYDKKQSSLEVTLAPSSSSSNAAKLVATIKNIGTLDLNLLKIGTILDDKLPVAKVTVTDESGNPLQFRGIHPSIRYDRLTASDFRLLKATESIEVNIDAAEVFNFPQSGIYSFVSLGLISTAIAPSISFSGPSATFASNSIHIYVDSEATSLIAPALPSLEARTIIQDGCNATELAASTKALANCVSLARAAAADAANPQSARFVEYFRTNSSTTRQTVVARLQAVANECSSTNSGKSSYACKDISGICSSEPLNAYTRWDVNYMVMCPLFYDTLPALPPGCHRQCQATTTIHEMTHCDSVYEPHTNDWAYAYNASTSLSPERALANADNYSLYANAVYLNC